MVKTTSGLINILKFNDLSILGAYPLRVFGRKNMNIFLVREEFKAVGSAAKNGIERLTARFCRP
jgi:hypothetical protein